VYGDPRTAAGGPSTGDVIACGLAPLDEVDADLGLTDDQLSRLRVVFPRGVCDWTQPGRGSGTTGLPWRWWSQEPGVPGADPGPGG